VTGNILYIPGVNDSIMMQSLEMERLCSLFFELSNEDRLSIILKLMKEPMKLTHIAKELDLTVQETSRQLARMNEIELVTKDPDGFYVLQPYGRHAIRLFPGFQFLTEHVDYFNRHTLDLLPERFMGRIGELRGSVPVTALMKTFSNIERLMRESEEFFWYMSDENLISSSHYVLALDALERGIAIRCIEPLGYRPPPHILDSISNEIKTAIDAYRGKEMLLDKVFEKIDLVMYMNEKEVGILALPTLTGEFDYKGFSSTDPKVLEWCKDLHRYYWERGSLRDDVYIKVRD
jgi:predicted transcriptional regulator